MAIIDPDGLFHGDRLRKCSTIAQLFWPRFFLAANGFARIEINYNSFLDGPLASLCPAPSKSDVMAMFREYFEHYLGFLYRCDGKVWCQFVTDERNLPRHKTKSDLRSPEPPSEEFKKWLEAYKETKQESQAIDLKDFEVIYETSEKVSEKFPKDFGTDVRGVGVGVGEGKNTSSEPTVSDEAVKLSEFLRDEILKNKPDFKLTPSQQKKWAISADRMIRLDSRQPRQIAEVIRWAQSDSFWKANILSMDKLREKFDQLELRRTANSGNQTTQPPPNAMDKFRENLERMKAN